MRTSLVIAAALAPLLSTAGCIDLETLEPADIVITPCPPALGGCALVADGATRIPIEVTVDVPAPHAALTVKLRLSAGTFVAPSDASRPSETVLALAAGDAVIGTMIPPGSSGWMRVDAEVGGLSVPEAIKLESASVDAVELTAAPGRLGDAMATAVTITARAPRGSLTAGTIAAIEITDRQPAGAFAQVTPLTGVVDAQGKVAVTLQKDATLRSITLTATVTPPPIDGMPSGTGGTGLITLTAPAMTP